MSHSENTPRLDVVPSFDALRESGRDNRGRFTAGHGFSLKHGRYAQLDTRPELDALHNERVAAITRDLGGDPSTLEASHAREVARLDLIVESLGNDLLERGVLTSKGRQRAALTAYLAAFDRLVKASATLGIERRSRAIPSARELLTGGVK